MIAWLTERMKNLPFYLIVIGSSLFICYKLFVQRTDSQKTVVQDGGNVNQWWKDAKISVLPLGCAILKAEKPLKMQ